VCDSHVRVHEEIDLHGRVINPDCLKDLDCVSVCPTEGLAFGFTKPSLFTRKAGGVGKAGKPVRHDLTWTEELLAGGTLVATLLIFRGLYDRIPFLMTLGLGGILAWLAIVAGRLWRRPNVRFATFQLRQDGRLRPAGWTYAAFSVLLLGFVAHSGLIRWHEANGQRLFLRLAAAVSGAGKAPPELVEQALGHLWFCERYGLFRSPELDRKIVSLCGASGRAPEAEGAHWRMIDRDPHDPGLRLALSEVLCARHRYVPANAQLREAVRLDPALHPAHYNLGVLLDLDGDEVGAAAAYQAAVRCNPEDADAHNNLARILARWGRMEDAEGHLNEALRLRNRASGTNAPRGLLPRPPGP
jgi:hypothetical protein